MTTPKTPWELGIDAFIAGQDFKSCPFVGFDEKNVELRWQWQKGWLHAQLLEEDLKRKTKP